MLINSLGDLEKQLNIISDLNISESAFSIKRFKLLEDLYSELKLLKSNFEARSLALYIRSLLKINFVEKYPINSFGIGWLLYTLKKHTNNKIDNFN